MWAYITNAFLENLLAVSKIHKITTTSTKCIGPENIIQLF